MYVSPIRIHRVLLKECSESDRPDFLRYQSDERYRKLYDFDDGGERPNQLFDLFLNWQREAPRTNFELGLFDAEAGDLLVCGGLRGVTAASAVLGVELAPDQWGRFRLAIDATAALLTLGFEVLGLEVIAGDTASGNRRVEKLAQWFGAELIASREGPEWMKSRGWHEVDWSISRDRWRQLNVGASAGGPPR